MRFLTCLPFPRVTTRGRRGLPLSREGTFT